MKYVWRTIVYILAKDFNYKFVKKNKKKILSEKGLWFTLIQAVELLGFLKNLQEYINKHQELYCPEYLISLICQGTSMITGFNI